VTRGKEHFPQKRANLAEGGSCNGPFPIYSFLLLILPLAGAMKRSLRDFLIPNS
jgi:hypothetical protein